VDCETLYHAVGCYFGPDVMKGPNGVGANFITDVMHDINVSLIHIDSVEEFTESNFMNYRKFCSVMIVSGDPMRKIIPGGSAYHVTNHTKLSGLDRQATRTGLLRCVFSATWNMISLDLNTAMKFDL